LVLHGHKHVPRYVHKHVDPPGGGWSEIHSVGSGTSLGAEGMPLSYNIVNWDSTSQQWAVSFFADSGDGSGFVNQYVAINSTT
jgi:hypothetical protein